MNRYFIKKVGLSIIVLSILLFVNFPMNVTANADPIDVIIHIDPETIIFEGDIIDCTITGDPTITYWQINGQSHHTTFYGDDPVIFDPEPTPPDDEFVELTVYAENEQYSDSETITLKVKRLYFGDIHFHSTISDGYNPVDELYQNTINDNYLDFVSLTDHAEIINQQDLTPPQPLWMRLRGFLQVLRHKILGFDEWDYLKGKVNEYYLPESFTTILGYEWSSGPWFPGGFLFSPNANQDVGHINFYYKDMYPDALEISAWEAYTFDDIFLAMEDEWDRGHLNVGFPHHPLSKFNSWGHYTVDWTFLANNMENPSSRAKILRGVETYSKWGTSIGKYSGLPVNWFYAPDSYVDEEVYWVENGIWEWSKEERVGQPFAMMASSDNHGVDRAGSASMQGNRIAKNHPNPSGLIAAYAVHNNRAEIWDAMNNCSIYGVQQLKMRANLRLDGQMAIGNWITCTSPLQIQVTALSTFPGLDSSGRSMTPHGYDSNELDYPIQDIWIIKKDTEKGQPWCKIIEHVEPDSDLAVIEFEDPDVQPNDFYYIAIRQKGQLLEGGDSRDDARDEFMSFIGPVFIESVE